MALDKQKILNELGSVVNQLQSANCGCLGNVFNNHDSNSHQQAMGYNTPHTCGNNHCGGTSGHSPGGPVQGSCGEPCPNGQAHGNCTHHHPSNFGNTARNHFDPALVQPIVKDVYEELKTMTPENTFVNSPIANQMGLPLAKDLHNMPNPCNAAHMPDIQKAMENAKAMQAMGNKFMTAVNVNQNSVNNETVTAQPNAPKLIPPPAYNVMQCQNCRTVTPAQQLPNNGLSPVPNNNAMLANPHQMSQNQSPYGQHAHGMAKFQELFPGVMGNGDLGFDPMAVAIKMNPNNQQGLQIPVAQNFSNHNQPATNAFPCAHLAQPQLNTSQNPVVPNISMPMAIPSIPAMGQPVVEPTKVVQSHNGLYPNEQQVYQVSPRPMAQDQQADNHGNPTHRPFHPATEKLMNEVLPGSHPTPKTSVCEHAFSPAAPVSNTQPQRQTIEYNTLGQPVEILPAEIYHKPEQTLPQTLSPQPQNLNNLPANYMKASMNKEYVVNNIASNKTPCLMANAMSYGTHSDGQLNVNSNQKNENNFLERTVGDTAVNNNISPRHQVDLHAGDKPDIPQSIAGAPEKLSPNSDRKHRNGLQDIVYTSYPKSTKWSFYGNARKTLPSGQRPV